LCELDSSLHAKSALEGYLINLVSKSDISPWGKIIVKTPLRFYYKPLIVCSIILQSLNLVPIFKENDGYKIAQIMGTSQKTLDKWNFNRELRKHSEKK
jgi:hypothetical protein